MLHVLFLDVKLTYISTIFKQHTHADEAKSLRDKRRAEVAQRRASAALATQREAEEEERKRILDDAKMEAEAKPGMVWNKETREYEYTHDDTQDSWRD